MQRAFGVMEFRAVDEDQRIIEGVANTLAVDDFGTVLEPEGARFTLPLPLLWQHRQDTPVGEVLEVDVTKKRIKIRAQLARIAEPGPLKSDIDRAWQAIKAGLVRGLSVGFQPLEGGIKGNRFVEWKWRELSLVTLPANAEATISKIRSAASGESPGVSGTPNPNPRRPMTIQEQITQHENSRAAKVARKQALMEASNTRGSTLDTAEAEEFDTLTQDVQTIDGHLVRLNSLKADNERAAVPVQPTASIPKPGVPVVRTASRVEPGTAFTRYAMAFAAARGNLMEAAERSKIWHDSTPEVELALRAAVAAGTTLDATWAGPLAPANAISNEFLELLRPATLLGKIPGLRRVPFNVSVPSQTSGGTYGWVGEGVAKPVTAAAFATVTLRWAKSAGIIVLTDELVRHSTPSAEGIIRQEMIAGIAQFLDGQFVDPAVAAVANVSPASITNGIAGATPGGTTEAFARSDLRALLKTFETNNVGLSGVVLLMTESMAFTLGTLVNSVGTQAFPGLGVAGGSLMGVPVVTSNTVGARIIAVHAPSILFADEGGVTLDISREASLQMDSAPDNPTTATTVMVSMFQRNLVALRAERYITWIRARTAAVNWIDTPAYV